LAEDGGGIGRENLREGKDIYMPGQNKKTPQVVTFTPTPHTPIPIPTVFSISKVFKHMT
jgi:hypothetical protein